MRRSTQIAQLGLALILITISSTPATVSASVTQAVDDFAETYPDTPITIDVLINDSGTSGSNIIGPEISEEPSNGSVKVSSERTITYTPSSGFVGVDDFVYSIESGGLSDKATVTVVVYSPICFSGGSIGAPYWVVDEDGDGTFEINENLTFRGSSGNDSICYDIWKWEWEFESGPLVADDLIVTDDNGGPFCLNSSTIPSEASKGAHQYTSTGRKTILLDQSSRTYGGGSLILCPVDIHPSNDDTCHVLRSNQGNVIVFCL